MAGRKNRQPGKPRSNQPSARPVRAADTVTAKRTSDGAWQLVEPRCAQDRAEDLEEVHKMIEAGEIDVAIDELRWLLNGCSDFLEAHTLLGTLAIEAGDLPLARGHFGYAVRLGVQALERAGAKGPLPYSLPANKALFESGKGLAWCLKELGKPELAAEVIGELLKLDPSDPLNVRGLLAQKDRRGDSAG